MKIQLYALPYHPYIWVYTVYGRLQILDTHFLALWLMAIELPTLLRGIKTFSIKRGYLFRLGALLTLFCCGIERDFE